MTPLDAARLRLSQVDAQTPPVEAERAARLVAKSCDRNQLADLLAETLRVQTPLVRQVQDCETRIFILTRAMELATYKTETLP